MGPFDFPTDIADRQVLQQTVRLLRERQVILPTFEELANPKKISGTIRDQLEKIGPDDPDALNLFRVHWYNDLSRHGFAETPHYLDLPESLTGVKARIVVALGALFPMIAAHKVLAAYACLAPRLVTGRFDPTRQRAIWPSTGNYCRGGVAISRILGCRGVAVLPEGMSQERFDWLQQWVAEPDDVNRTPGTESNVKEIYDACAELAKDPDNEIVNQFSEFGNYLGHFVCTGGAFEDIFQDLSAKEPGLRLTAFVAASGSAGTLGAGDYLKERHGAQIGVIEPTECPTLLYNGYGEHNIQGIGDKHVPLIHNVMNTDFVIGVSDKATDGLNVLFNTSQGQAYLTGQGIASKAVANLRYFGLSGIANLLGAIKLAKTLDLGREDVIVTVATDSADMYASERAQMLSKFPGKELDMAQAGALCGEYLRGAATDHVLQATETDRRRMFNLGYYTWVEQQGIALPDFDQRKNQGFWQDLTKLVGVWDELIAECNKEIRAAAA